MRAQRPHTAIVLMAAALAVAIEAFYVTRMRATPFHWPIKPRACAVVRVNNSRSIWENILTCTGMAKYYCKQY